MATITIELTMGDIQPHEALDERFKNSMQLLMGQNNLQSLQVTRVIQKRLTRTDVNPQKARLEIPVANLDDNILTEREKQHLRVKENGRRNKLEIELLAPWKAASEKATLAWWNLSPPKYAINGDWNTFAKKLMDREVGLTEGMTVQLWCYRLNQKLSFVLVPMD